MGTDLVALESKNIYSDEVYCCSDVVDDFFGSDVGEFAIVVELEYFPLV